MLSNYQGYMFKINGIVFALKIKEAIMLTEHAY